MKSIKMLFGVYKYKMLWRIGLLCLLYKNDISAVPCVICN